MERIKRALWLVIMICLLSIPTLVAQTQEAVVVVEHWPPWEIAYDEAKKEVSGGMAVEILQEMFNRLKVKMTLKTVPWKRALASIETGTADLIPILSKDDERAVYMAFTESMYSERALLCYSTKKMRTFEWDSWADLRALTIGHVRGYSVVEETLSENGVTKTEPVVNDETNLRKLIGGRIDLAVIYSSSLPLLKEIPGYENIKFAKKPLIETVWYNGISKKSFLVDLLPEINAILKEMKRDGTFKRILKDYYQAD